MIDKEGFDRAGNRLEQAGLSYEERHPLILPSSHHVTTLLVTYYHGTVQHQGRHFTLGLIRSSGFWIIRGKRIVNNVINSCIKCKKLRGQQQIQKMADLPVKRLTPAPPFSYVGLDVFGPWTVSARRTRGGVANSKRWAVLFTCLTIRAIHIELLESMDTSSFINALCRFLALRVQLCNFALIAVLTSLVHTTHSSPALKRWMKVPSSRTWPLRVAIGSLTPLTPLMQGAFGNE